MDLNDPLVVLKKSLWCIIYISHTGFTEGYIRWDDEDSNNGNRRGGQIPDGRYDRNTVIYYCCRADGHATNPIILPTDSPFVLLKSNTDLCQYVRGMKVSSEWFSWDCEDSRPSNGVGGLLPPRSIVDRNVRVDYCYYYRWLNSDFLDFNSPICNFRA